MCCGNAVAEEKPSLSQRTALAVEKAKEDRAKTAQERVDAVYSAMDTFDNQVNSVANLLDEVDPNASATRGRSLFHQALMTKNYKLAACWLNSGKITKETLASDELICSFSSDYSEANEGRLSWEKEKAGEALLRALLKAGVNPNTKCYIPQYSGEYPMIEGVVSYWRSHPVTQILLEAGAKVDTKTLSGAIFGGDPEIVHLLLASKRYTRQSLNRLDHCGGNLLFNAAESYDKKDDGARMKIASMLIAAGVQRGVRANLSVGNCGYYQDTAYKVARENGLTQTAALLK